MILAGQPWVNALIQAYDATVQVTWLKNDGDRVAAGEAFFLNWQVLRVAYLRLSVQP